MATPQSTQAPRHQTTTTAAGAPQCPVAAHEAAPPQLGTAVPDEPAVRLPTPAPPVWQMCWSSWNFSSFMVWFNQYATLEEQRAASDLYMVVHRQKPSEFLEAHGIIPEEVDVNFVRRDGVSVHLPRLTCKDVGCRRCDEGRGGYQWRWCDPRWTPSSVLDMGLTPQEMAKEAYRPWPRGLLPCRSTRRDTETHPATRPAGPDAPTSPAGRPQGPPAAADSNRQRKKAQRRQEAQAAQGRRSAPQPGRAHYAEPAVQAPSESSGPQAWMLLAMPEPSFTPAALVLPSSADTSSPRATSPTEDPVVS